MRSTTRSRPSASTSWRSRRALGVRLFDRSPGPRTVELTEAGRLLLRPRRDDRGPPAGRAGGPRRVRGGGDRHAAGGRLPERRHADPAGDHRPLQPGMAGRGGPALGGRQRRGPHGHGGARAPRPHLRRAPDARRAVRRRRAPAGSVRARRRPVASPLAGLAATPSMQLIGEQRLIGFRSCRSTKWVEQQLRAAGTEPQLRVPLRGQRDGPGDGGRRPRHRARAAARGRHGGPARSRSSPPTWSRAASR